MKELPISQPSGPVDEARRARRAAGRCMASSSRRPRCSASAAASGRRSAGPRPAPGAVRGRRCWSAGSRWTNPNPRRSARPGRRSPAPGATATTGRCAQAAGRRGSRGAARRSGRVRPAPPSTPSGWAVSVRSASSSGWRSTRDNPPRRAGRGRGPGSGRALAGHRRRRARRPRAPAVPGWCSHGSPWMDEGDFGAAAFSRGAWRPVASRRPSPCRRWRRPPCRGCAAGCRGAAGPSSWST